MATLEDIKVILNSLDPTQLTIIAALIGLVLVLLIFFAFRPKRSDRDIPIPKEQTIGPSSNPTRHQTPVKTEEPGSEQDSIHAQKPTVVDHRPAMENRSDVRVDHIETPSEAEQIPQDSVLRRHYLANEAAKEIGLHEPYPTDSVLRRHYDADHKIVVEDMVEQAAPNVPSVLAADKPISQVPEDSVLRRHYLANEAAKELALHEPYPTDSVLQRHFDQSHKIITEQVAATADGAAQYPKAEAPTTPQKASIIEQAIGKQMPASVSAKAASSPKPDIAEYAEITVIPQDSVLKRHFISQLRAEIEANMAAKPTDSVLRRHYDSLVGVELERRLSS